MTISRTVLLTFFLIPLISHASVTSTVPFVTYVYEDDELKISATAFQAPQGLYPAGDIFLDNFRIEYNPSGFNRTGLTKTMLLGSKPFTLTSSDLRNSTLNSNIRTVTRDTTKDYYQFDLKRTDLPFQSIYLFKNLNRIAFKKTQGPDSTLRRVLSYPGGLANDLHWNHGVYGIDARKTLSLRPLALDPDHAITVEANLGRKFARLIVTPTAEGYELDSVSIGEKLSSNKLYDSHDVKKIIKLEHGFELTFGDEKTLVFETATADVRVTLDGETAREVNLKPYQYKFKSTRRPIYQNPTPLLQAISPDYFNDLSEKASLDAETRSKFDLFQSALEETDKRFNNNKTAAKVRDVKAALRKFMLDLGDNNDEAQHRFLKMSRDEQETAILKIMRIKRELRGDKPLSFELQYVRNFLWQLSWGGPVAYNEAVEYFRQSSSVNLKDLCENSLRSLAQAFQNINLFN